MAAKRCDYATPAHRCQQPALYTVTYWLAGKQRSAKRCGTHNGAASLPDGATQIEADFVASDHWGGDADAWKR